MLYQWKINPLLPHCINFYFRKKNNQNYLLVVIRFIIYVNSLLFNIKFYEINEKFAGNIRIQRKFAGV